MHLRKEVRGLCAEVTPSLGERLEASAQRVPSFFRREVRGLCAEDSSLL